MTSPAHTDYALHFANASLWLDTHRPLALAPAYDMLPMHYRPNALGEIVDRPFEVAIAPPRLRIVAGRAARMAVAFWERVQTDDAVSEDFRRVVEGHAVMVAGAAA